MDLLKAHSISCPYCGEGLSIDVDCSVDFQQYVEDCQVCCRPISMSVSVDEAYNPSVSVQHEDE